MATVIRPFPWYLFYDLDGNSIGDDGFKILM
jgi:hypothetical protein